MYHSNLVAIRKAWKKINEATKTIEEVFNDERFHCHGSDGELKRLKAVLKAVEKANDVTDRFAYRDN